VLYKPIINFLKQEVIAMAKQEKRNGHAFHPIMSKGGVHEKTEKSKRKAAKHDLNRKVKEWLGRSSFAA
jgi:hypothetical protein